MTEPDTPAQQLARIAELEQAAKYDDAPISIGHVVWLCALARKGVEAGRTSSGFTEIGKDNTVTPQEGQDGTALVSPLGSRPQSPEGTP